MDQARHQLAQPARPCPTRRTRRRGCLIIGASTKFETPRSVDGGPINRTTDWGMRTHPEAVDDGPDMKWRKRSTRRPQGRHVWCNGLTEADTGWQAWSGSIPAALQPASRVFR